MTETDEVLAVYLETRDYHETALRLGMQYDAVRKRVKRHLPPGSSTLVKVPDSEIALQWLRTPKEARTGEEVAEHIKSIFSDFTFVAPPVPAPGQTNGDCVSLFNLPDLHLGLYGYGKEVGENWDLKKADRVYRRSFTDLVSMTPHNDTAIVLAGGDQMHSDNSDNKTARSGHSLDVDGRYERVLQVTCELFLHFILTVLQTHENVIVRVLKGNHDHHAAAALAYFLLASFRDNPRVTVDVSPSLFWVYQFGKVMLAATHGHTVTPQKMPGIMAARWPEIWGKTQFRYAHTFHVHHQSKFVHEDGGVIVETHHSPAPQDSYNYGHGYLSGRSLSSIVYHKKYGKFGGATRPILPETS